MKSVSISLKSEDSTNFVKEFVNIVNRFDCDFDLLSGRYIIDAKSIMGIFSLDLNSPIELAIHTTDKALLQEIENALSDYIVG